MKRLLLPLIIAPWIMACGEASSNDRPRAPRSGSESAGRSIYWPDYAPETDCLNGQIEMGIGRIPLQDFRHLVLRNGKQVKLGKAPGSTTAQWLYMAEKPAVREAHQERPLPPFEGSANWLSVDSGNDLTQEERQEVASHLPAEGGTPYFRRLETRLEVTTENAYSQVLATYRPQLGEPGHEHGMLIQVGGPRFSFLSFTDTAERYTEYQDTSVMVPRSLYRLRNRLIQSACTDLRSGKAVSPEAQASIALGAMPNPSVIRCAVEVGRVSPQELQAIDGLAAIPSPAAGATSQSVPRCSADRFTDYQQTQQQAQRIVTLARVLLARSPYDLMSIPSWNTAPLQNQFMLEFEDSNLGYPIW